MNEVEPYLFSAFKVSDWSKPGERIGDRKKPLAANTIKRIKWGLDKCADANFVIYTDNSSLHKRASGVTDPITSPEYTMTIQHNFGVAGMPMLSDEQNKNGKSRPLSEHVSTILSGGNHHGFVGIPMIIKNYGGGFDPKNAPIPIEKTLGTLTTVDSHALLGIPFIVENRGQSNTRDINQAMSTQTSMITHGIASTEAVNAFLAYYYGNNQASGMFDTVGTIPTNDRLALVLSAPKTIDIND